MKFKKGDKVICITDAYLTISLGNVVTVKKFLDEDFFLIEDYVDIYESDDFVKPILLRGDL